LSNFTSKILDKRSCLYLSYIKGRTLSFANGKFCENISLDIIALSVIIGLLALEDVENFILFFVIIFTGVLSSRMILKCKFFLEVFFSNLKSLAFFGILFLYGNLFVGFGPLAGFVLFREIFKLWQKIILAHNYGELFIFGNFTLAKICVENLKCRITWLILPTRNFEKSKHKNGNFSRNCNFVKIAEFDINFQKDFQIEKTRGITGNSRGK